MTDYFLSTKFWESSQPRKTTPSAPQPFLRLGEAKWQRPYLRSASHVLSQRIGLTEPGNSASERALFGMLSLRDPELKGCKRDLQIEDKKGHGLNHLEGVFSFFFEVFFFGRFEVLCGFIMCHQNMYCFFLKINDWKLKQSRVLRRTFIFRTLMTLGCQLLRFGGVLVRELIRNYWVCTV